ncbi:MAG: tRNA dihydrouridine synthase DusB [Clostridia bacterium]|nr:tRNA dihydrouridine synthase DusB [Clostridia bacterium]
MLKELLKREYPILLGPMAGVTDRVFRRICRANGSMAAYTPMISAKSIVYGNEATEDLMQADRDEPMLALQFFTHEPDVLREAAEKTDLSPYAWVDINMGCPTPKVTKQGDGCALMKEPEKARELIRILKQFVSCPVSIKMRAGWDAGHLNAVSFAKMAEDAGADMICVHPRTAVQMYRGRADARIWEQVSAAVGIPVVASGDMDSLQQARTAFDAGCAGIMIARGSYGDPWIFSRLAQQLRGREYAEPSDTERFATAVAHARMLAEDLPERVAMLQMRKHIAWYIHGYRDAAVLRARINETVTLRMLEEEICRYAEQTLDIAGEALLERAHKIQKSVMCQ